MPDNFFSGLSATIRYRAGEAGNMPVLKQFDSIGLDNDLFQLNVDQENKIIISATLKKAIAIELFSVKFKIPKHGSIKCLDRFYKIVPVKQPVWNNGFTPLFVAVTGEQNFILFNTGRMFSHRVTGHVDFFDLEVFLDAAAEHPSWNFTGAKRSTSSPVLPAGTSYNMEFGILQLPHAPAASFPVIARYPNGASAAFTITDHCDFDSNEKLDVFLNGDDRNPNAGWLNKGLKMTKGVFTKRSTGPNTKQNDTLETPAYRTLIEQLYADGSEIAPHALNQSGQITPEDFTNALNNIQVGYHPQTWIDHGLYLKYCYYMGGKEDPGYQLIKALEDRQFTSLWSYQDVPVDPNASLNQFSNTAPTFKPARKAIRKMLSGNFLVAGHEFKSMVQRKDEAVNRMEPILSFMSSGRAAIMNIRSAKNRKKTLNKLKADFFGLFKSSAQQQLPYTQEELLQFSPLLYSEKGKPLHQLQQNDMLLFATQEITQLDGIYTGEALDKLISEKGAHIGHTYILNDLPYIDGVFEKKTTYRLSNYWVKFIDALAQRVKSGEIWNPTFAEFVDYVKKSCLVSLEYISDKTLIVHNAGNKDINGLTFMMHITANPTVLWDKQKPAFRNDASGNLLFWGNVPANAQSVIEWQ